MAYKDRTKLISYNNQYNTEKYDRVTVMLPKGGIEKLKTHDAARGESVNAFLQRAIQETMERDRR